jgi:hypothetical protein
MSLVFYIKKFIFEVVMNQHNVEMYSYKFDKNGFLIYNHLPFTIKFNRTVFYSYYNSQK